MQVVAYIAARLGPVSRLQSGGFTKLVDQRLCFDNIARFDIERQNIGWSGFLLGFGWQTGPGETACLQER